VALALICPHPTLLPPAFFPPCVADNDAPGDALAEELARRLGRERCWRVRWPLNEEDHQYAAELGGVPYIAGLQLEAANLTAEELAASINGSSSSNGAKSAAAATEGATAARSQGPPEGSAEALQLRVQPAYYRKDANEVLMKDGAGMLRAFLENAEPFPIRGLLRWGWEWGRAGSGAGGNRKTYAGPLNCVQLLHENV
jgi:hypothetical protein